jgi:hypothetical protein
MISVNSPTFVFYKFKDIKNLRLKKEECFIKLDKICQV